MNRLVDDLRFFIGAFFLIVGVLLVLQGALAAAPAGQEYNLNLMTGAAFVIFAVLALYLSIRAGGRDR
jgi:hypothetical protein